MRAAELASNFRIAGIVEFAETGQSLVRTQITLDGMSGELFLQGAQVTGWQPAGDRPVIFTSRNAVFATGKAIRGGVPIIFPWFGPHPTRPELPQHGLVRTADWRLDAVERGGPGEIAMELSFDTDEFLVRYRVTFGPKLQLALTVQNRTAREIAFEEALHSYFAISDIEQVSVGGLERCSFIDKTAGMRRRPPAGAALSLSKETDSVYLDTPESLTLHDPGWRRRIRIDKTGAASTIVWNPWAEKAAAMADLGADQWRGMICAETGNVADNRVTLAAGGEHQMSTRIAVDAAP